MISEASEWNGKRTGLQERTPSFAKGRCIRQLSGTSLKKLRCSGLLVSCTCPSGETQLERNVNGEPAKVCKHAYAALMTVLDQNFNKKTVDEEIEALTKEKEEREMKATEEKKKWVEGERKRIGEVFTKLGDAQVVKVLLEKMNESEDGVEDVRKFFPSNADDDPDSPNRRKREHSQGENDVRNDAKHAEKEFKCVRCKIEYEPDDAQSRSCRVPHPYSCVSKIWNGSKQCYNHCKRCNRTFNLDGYSSFSRCKSDPEDDGEYCFVRLHTTDEQDLESDPYGVDESDDY